MSNFFLHMTAHLLNNNNKEPQIIGFHKTSDLGTDHQLFEIELELLATISITESHHAAAKYLLFTSY